VLALSGCRADLRGSLAALPSAPPSPSGRLPPSLPSIDLTPAAPTFSCDDRGRRGHVSRGRESSCQQAALPGVVLPSQAWNGQLRLPSPGPLLKHFKSRTLSRRAAATPTLAMLRATIGCWDRLAAGCWP
jgi:hypothetical protein